jgi:WD40 repeat protein
MGCFQFRSRRIGCRVILAVIVCLFGFVQLVPSLLGAAEVSVESSPQFDSDIQPVFNRFCVGCHGPDEPEGGLRLDSYAGVRAGSSSGPVVGKGTGQENRLLEVLFGTGDTKMPPEDQPQLDESTLQLLKRWIEAGAPGPEAGPSPIPKVLSAVPSGQASGPVTAVVWAPSDEYYAFAKSNEVVLRKSTTATDASEPATKSERRKMEPAWKSLHVPFPRIADLAFVAGGSQLLIAGGSEGTDGYVSAWDLAADEPHELQRWADHADMIYALAVSPDGRRFASGSYDRTIVIRDLEQNKVMHVLKGHNGAIFDVAFSYDGKVLVSASADATVKVWNVESGQRLDTLSQPQKEQLSVDMSADGKWIAAAGDDNRIRIWDLISVDSPQINPLRIARFGHEGSIYCVRFTPDGRFLLSLSSDRSIKVWSVPEMNLVYEFEPQPANTQVMAISPVGDALVVGRMDGTQDLISLPRVAPPFISSTDPLDEPTKTEQLSNRLESEIPVDKNDIIMSDESEPNDAISQAMPVLLPFRVEGRIGQDADPQGTGGVREADQDLYRFSTQEGTEWVFEVRAQGDKSSLDSYLAVLTPEGELVPRVRLQATRDSYFTFRGKNSDDVGDFRLHHWEEMRLNQYLYANGEVVKFFHYPRGPDSGFNVYPNEGLRHGFFETTPLAHAVNEPCYVVEPHPPEEAIAANGLPSFLIPYENDDASDRSLGADSRLSFKAPASGDYILMIKDVRGLSGPEFRYQLTARPRRPDFVARIDDAEKLAVTAGTGVRFGISLDRRDNFDGPVSFHFTGVPDGVLITQPLVVEAGHSRASGTVFVPAVFPADYDWTQVKIEVHAEFEIDGKLQQRTLGELGKIEISPAKSPIRVQLTPSSSSGSTDAIEIVAGRSATAEIRIDRQAFQDRVGFGSEDAVRNLPHGVFVANTGLNGVLIVEGTSERTIFLQAEPWVQPGERWVFVEAEVDGRPTSAPILLRVISPP